MCRQTDKTSYHNLLLIKLIVTFFSEIVVACVDASLEVTVARNIAKTLQLFAVKSEQLVLLTFIMLLLL